MDKQWINRHLFFNVEDCSMLFTHASEEKPAVTDPVSTPAK